MVVQHNLTAMNANRMLNVTTSTQAKSTQKLSSGFKINTAADDAAGLSISEKMRRQVRGLNQATANAQDGISAVQTAEGALGEVTDMLQRMQQLAVKGENGTLTTADRVDVQNEVAQLMSEINRVQSTTTFNNQNLLTGEFTDKGLQVGAEAGQHINISIANMNMQGLINKAATNTMMYNVGDASKETGVRQMTMNAAAAKKVVERFSGLVQLGTSGADQYKMKTDTKLRAGELASGQTPSTSATGTAGQPIDNIRAQDFASLNAFVKSALKTVSAQRSDLGAIQNRLEHTIKNLDNIAENTTAAESAIRDTDIATEMVAYSNNNILSQAGTSMLAQANQSNQNALSLLG